MIFFHNTSLTQSTSRIRKSWLRNYQQPISAKMGGPSAMAPAARRLSVHRTHLKQAWRPLCAVRRPPAVTANRGKHTESTEEKRRIRGGDRRLCCSSVISRSTDGPVVSFAMEVPTEKTPRSSDSATETAVLRSCPFRRTARDRSPR